MDTIDAPVDDTDKALDDIVDMYIANDMVDIPLVPDFMERRIYKTVLKLCIDAVRSKLQPSSSHEARHVLGHGLSLALSPRVIYDSVTNDRTSTNTNTNTDTDDNEQHKQRTIVIDTFVESFIRSDDIQIPGVPDFMERRLYRNILKMLLGVVHDTLRTSKIRFLGHEISFGMSSLPYPSWPSNDGDDVYDDDTRAIIDAKVDEIMRSEDNMFLVPDFIERRVYTQAFRMTVAVLTKLVRSCEVVVLNHSIKCDVVPSTMRMRPPVP